MLWRGCWSRYAALLVASLALTCLSSAMLVSMSDDARAESFGVAWGNDVGGELGNGQDWERNKYEASDVPVGVCALDSAEAPCPTGPYLNEVVSMTAGAGFSLAVLFGGRVTGWGGNQQGELGVNSTGFTYVPFSESFTSGVSAVATGYRFSLALLNNGTVDAFGDNISGQLGNGTSGVERNWEPKRVNGLVGVTAVAAGGEHALALLSNGKVMAWGANNSGQLGNGTTTKSDVPVEVSELSEVVAISAGEGFSLALLKSGAVKAWGENNLGQLGDGATTNSHVPVAVSELSGVTKLAAGKNFSLALLSGGTVKAWGYNEWGQLGDGTNTGPNVCKYTAEEENACSTSPVAVSNLSGAVAISAGNGSSALRNDHTVWTWGADGNGQLGQGAFEGHGCETLQHIPEKCSTTPVEVLGLESVDGISTGAAFELAWTSIVPRPTQEELFGPENPGEPNQQRSCSGDPVSCATGNLSESQTDLSVVPGRGIPLTLTRTYNAQAAVTQSSPGPFGYGWSSSFSDHLQISPEAGTVTVVQANRSAVIFNGTPGTVGEFTAPKWAQATLSLNSEHTYVYTLPNQEVFKFNEQGRLLSETDRNGNTTSLSYTETGLLETVTDPAGRKLTFAYNTEGRVESVKDPMGHTVKYAYENGSLISATEPGESSPRWRFEYDPSHRLTKMTDGRGGTTINEYDSSNRVIIQTDPANRTSTFEYAPYETMIVDRATGEAIKEVFTEGYEPESVTHGYGSANATTGQFTYDEAGDLKSVIDGDGHKTQYGYDNMGNRTSMIDAEKDETKWTYNSTHDVLTTTTPEGETTTIKRDSHSNPETIERPAPGSTKQTTKYTYNSAGELETMTDPLGRTWKYEYDNEGDRTSETDPEGDKRTWQYNEDSQQAGTVSPRGNVTGGEPAKYTTKIERDAQGRPLTITDPLGHSTKYTYDANGNLETQTDPNGHKTTYTYDVDNERTKIEEPNGTITETGYDGTGRVTSQTDGNKHTTKYTRNILEQVTEIADPLGHKTTNEYDAAGNLTKLTDAAKRTTTYKYDPANRLNEITYSDGKTHAVQYEYNGDGKRTKMIDGTGTTTYAYDQLDRLTESKDGHGNLTKYEYDLASEQTKILYPNSKTVEHTYDKQAGWHQSRTGWATPLASDTTLTRT